MNEKSKKKQHQSQELSGFTVMFVFVILIVIAVAFFVFMKHRKNRAEAEYEYNGIESAVMAAEEKLDSEISTNINTKEMNTGQSKIQAYNNIEGLRTSLSENGIGTLGQWKSDMMGGYMSITDYYQFGSGIPQSNIAYYIESEKYDIAQSVTVSLNINNQVDKDKAIHLFSSTIDKTFKSIALSPSREVIQSIKSGKNTEVDQEDYSLSFSVDKGNIERWVLKIKSK